MKKLHLKTITAFSIQKASFMCTGICILFYFFSITGASAQGSLMLLPKRVLLEGNKKFAEVSLANIGLDTANYTISVVNMRMEESGRQVIINEEDTTQAFADKYLRIYPHQVKLWASKSQTVKVQLVHGARLEPGEYRSHLYFRAVPKAVALGTNNGTKDTAAGITVGSLRPIFGITIPVIVRIGTLPEPEVTLSGVSIIEKDSTHNVCMTFHRQGTISSYSDLTVTYISKDGRETEVGHAKGISLYTQLNNRYFTLTLQQVEGVNYNEGRLHLVVRNLDNPKKAIQTEADVDLDKKG